MNTLNSDAAGKYLIKTKHSEYVLDLDASTVKRIAGKEANVWHDSDVTYPLLGFSGAETGESLYLIVDHPDLWVRSTPVVSIDPIWDDAA